MQSCSYRSKPRKKTGIFTECSCEKQKARSCSSASLNALLKSVLQFCVLDCKIMPDIWKLKARSCSSASLNALLKNVLQFCLPVLDWKIMPDILKLEARSCSSASLNALLKSVLQFCISNWKIMPDILKLDWQVRRPTTHVVWRTRLAVVAKLYILASCSQDSLR